MRKIVSIALFGEGDKYAQFLPAFIRGHLSLYPKHEDWELYVHVDKVKADDRWGAYLSRLEFEGLLKTVVMSSSPLTKAMLWRMSPVFENGVDFVFCRDLDAPPMPRDRLCMELFMRAAQDAKVYVHTIHDNQMHVGIMGGLCGFYAPGFRDATGYKTLDDLYAAANTTDAQWATHGQDQIALNRLLLKAGGPRVFEHRFAGWWAGPKTQAARRVGRYACGGVSAPVPDGNNDPADLLGNHLGAAGYDYENAIKFWNERGDRKIMDLITDCEMDLF